MFLSHTLEASATQVAAHEREFPKHHTLQCSTWKLEPASRLIDEIDQVLPAHTPCRATQSSTMGTTARTTSGTKTTKTKTTRNIAAAAAAAAATTTTTTTTTTSSINYNGMVRKPEIVQTIQLQQAHHLDISGRSSANRCSSSSPRYSASIFSSATHRISP